MRRSAPLACAAAVAALLTPAPADAARGVKATLDDLAERGALTAEERRSHLRTWRRARRAVRRLDGDEQWNFKGVLANTRSLARRGMLGARVAPAFLTLERNLQWFWDERRATAAYGARHRFRGSPLIWQFYPRSGWQIQPLANFGRLNAWARRQRTKPARLARYADALLAVAVRRDGFLAFEYHFPWSGGGPGWISGMATATGAAALARVWERTGDDRYRDAADATLGAFFAAPPEGVRVNRGRGRSHYLLYSQSPRLFVGNGFAQALIGLDVVAEITASARARTALERGLAQAEIGMPRYDTGAWSLYWRRPGTSRGDESTLHYHQLFSGFLETLCERFPDRAFCGLRERFERYETEPVRIARPRVRRVRSTLRVVVPVSKRGSGTLTLQHGDRVLRRSELALSRGRHVVRWRAPKRRGRYVVRVDAVSLNGLESTRARSVKLR